MSGNNELEYTKAPAEHLQAYEGLKKWAMIIAVVVSIALLIMAATLTNA